MSIHEFSGKTVEDALSKALSALGLREADVVYTVVEEPSKGFLGFGAKEAKISVRPVEKNFVAETTPEPTPVADVAPAPEAVEPTEIIIEEVAADALVGHTVEELGLAYLGPIFQSLNIQPVVVVEEKNDAVHFHIKGDDVGILIGRRGETLNALQFLLSLAINRQSDGHNRIVLDCENYRARREETLAGVAARMADKARQSGRRVSLEPMNAAERRLVHLALEKEEGISAESSGEEPNRRIVIYPKK